jgi:hypothetical protein
LGLRAERIPIKWTHLIGKESLNTEKLEHSLISPEIVRAILAGQQPVELTPTRLVMLSRNLPHDWQEQRRLLGFAPA